MKNLHWYDHLAINSYWLGINIASGILTPILMPALVLMFMPVEMKNTYLANLRVIGLSVAMLFQPIAGFWSDRSNGKNGPPAPVHHLGCHPQCDLPFYHRIIPLLHGRQQ